MIPDKVVTLLEILRCYAEKYVLGAQALTMISADIEEAQRGGNDPKDDPALIKKLRYHVGHLSKYCEFLPMTSKAILSLVHALDNPIIMSQWTNPDMLHLLIADVQLRLTDELAENVFLRLYPDRIDHFVTPWKGWESHRTWNWISTRNMTWS